MHKLGYQLNNLFTTLSIYILLFILHITSVYIFITILFFYSYQRYQNCLQNWFKKVHLYAVYWVVTRCWQLIPL